MTEKKHSIKLMVCAATKPELKCYGELRDKEWEQVNKHYISRELCLYISGVGVPETWENLLYWSENFSISLILNIGIAGAYPGFRGEIGDVVIGSSEIYGDLGVEIPVDSDSSESSFENISQFSFGSFYRTTFPLFMENSWLDLDLPFKIIQGQGCTVNMCSGTNIRGQSRRMATQSDFETMEAAAFAQYGKLKKIPVVEIRAISNIAGYRNMQPENIQLALKNLSRFIKKFKELYDPKNLHKHFTLPQ